MMRHPKPGTPAQAWYKPSAAAVLPLHGQVGRVLICARPPRKGELPALPPPLAHVPKYRGPGPAPIVRFKRVGAPRNHAVEFAGAWYVVPGGNLRKPK